MDQVDEKILDLMKGNARISYQELGDELGMSRVAAKKRVQKLEAAGIIRGYNTTIYRDEERMLLIEIETLPGKYEKVLKYVATRTAYIRQILGNPSHNYIHMVAASTDREGLKYLIRMIEKKCGEDCERIDFHLALEIVKDVYGGVRYDNRERKLSRDEGDI